MVLATYHKYGIRLTHIWFASEQEIKETIESKTPKTDVLFVHGADMSDFSSAYSVSRQKTLIKHIGGTEEDIWGTFGKHLRKFINRSINENTTVKIFYGKDINDSILKQCAVLYEDMKRDKGIPDHFNMELAKLYARQENLLVSLAYSEGEAIGFKASIIDCRCLRGWVSAFCFREHEEAAQLIGRAHQQLEWETMKYCLQRGIRFYDFGGIDSFENPNGIAKFKMALAKEGDHVCYDNFLIGKSWIGKLAVSVKKKISKK